MNHIFPTQIIEEVYRLSLQGLSERKIAHIVGDISVGSIHNLLDEFKSSDYNYHLLRTLAVNLYKNGTDTKSYAFLVRLYNIWKRLGVTEDQFEAILTELPVYIYKSKLSARDFVCSLKKFKEFIEIHGDDPRIWNNAINWYHAKIECYKQQLGVQISDNGLQSTESGQNSEFNTLDTELVLSDLLNHMLTDYEVDKLNSLRITRLTREQVLNQILRIIKNPSEYEEVF